MTFKGTKNAAKKFWVIPMLLFSLVLILGSCEKDSGNNEVNVERNKTVVAYIVGDINLWYELEKTVNLFEQGWVDGTDGAFLVYLDCSPHLTQFGVPVLLEIKHDETDAIVSRVVKSYPDQDAMDPKVMNTVLSDARNMYPAKSHGLIIGTHGSGWWPEASKHESPSRALIGPDRYQSHIEIYELAEALPGHYEFILFHACFMSNIESVYQLRKKCDYIMAPILALEDSGYPYDEITQYLFTQPKADLYHAAKKSIEWYKKRNFVGFEYFSVQVINTSKLENFAQKTSEYLKLLNLKNSEIQDKFDEFGVVTYMDKYNDMIHLLAIGNENIIEDYYKALTEVVIFSDFVLNPEDQIKYKNSSGLSFYLPKQIYTEPNAIYNTKYDWSKDSGIGQNN